MTAFLNLFETLLSIRINFTYYLYITLGKNVLMIGNAARIIRVRKSVRMNGITPRIICAIGTFTTVAMAKRLRPNGGVMLPISQILTISTLYHIKSKLSAAIAG